MDYELKIIQLEKEYKQKCKEFDEEKMEQFIKRKMKNDTAELLNFNIKNALG